MSLDEKLELLEKRTIRFREECKRKDAYFQTLNEHRNLQNRIEFLNTDDPNVILKRLRVPSKTKKNSCCNTFITTIVSFPSWVIEVCMRKFMSLWISSETL